MSKMNPFMGNDPQGTADCIGIEPRISFRGPVALCDRVMPSRYFLAPLAGYTNLALRRTIRELGGLGLATTDLVNARALLKGSRKTLDLIATTPDDRPTAVQIYGSESDYLRAGAQYLEAAGFGHIDINMGCPVRKVCNVGGGSAMMTELAKTVALVRDMVNAVKIPVTAKMRLGWDDQNITAPDLARALEDAGVAAIFVHGRTRQQGFGGNVNLAGIRKVVEAVKTIPIIGNGDVITPQAAKKMLDETGCAGVSIGRGAFYNPWIFRRTLHYLAGDELLPEPSFSERAQVMCRHLDLMIEVFGETLGCRMFRKVAPWYSKRFGPCHEFNRRAVQISTRAEFHGVLEDYIRWRQQFLDEKGELLPRFQPPPMVASFMREPASTIREQIPVPKGPVEVW